ncbi:hypothetical protein DYB32_004321 [Aphanomyces invadans]|uniref:DDE Tnp4 domain-containing protein n=1 Tax=Aphanomyces invadans TaxID=157072 RepID=A0A418B3F7_9STRA|nr:hypothetical protein DYB32_004321 [Aphanomyces invadans]
MIGSVPLVVILRQSLNALSKHYIISKYSHFAPKHTDSDEMARRASLLSQQSTQLTTRSINQGVALLENLEQQRQDKRARYSAVRPDDPDNDVDSNSPVYDAFMETQGAECIMTLTNFSPAEFNVLWADMRQYVLKHWNVGSGRKSEVSGRDLLFMSLAALKHCGTWDVVAAVFKQKPPTFEKRVIVFINVLHPFLLRNYTIFDENREFHLACLSKRSGEEHMADIDDDAPGGRHQWAVLADKGYQGIQHDLRAIIPMKKPMGGILTSDELRNNDRIASDRAIVENFFGRLKTLWAVCSDTYRWSRKNYDLVFQTCLALTNVHVRLHPLRAEDGQANAQYVNRLSAIGAKIVKNKRVAARTYRTKRKARLSLVMAAESSLGADAADSDTDLGSHYGSENGDNSRLFM